MKKVSCKDNPMIFWHGSPSGDLRGGKTGLHVGTKRAATQALEARIGIPAKGEWDGTREYGKTLLAGRKNIAERQKRGEKYCAGINCDAPQEDFYPVGAPESFKKHLKYADKTMMPLNVKPVISPFLIVGDMTNTPSRPHDDFKANGYMAAQKKKGTAKRGYFYKNVGEDYGSISATVPNGKHLLRIKCKD